MALTASHLTNLGKKSSTPVCLLSVLRFANKAQDSKTPSYQNVIHALCAQEWGIWNERAEKTCRPCNHHLRNINVWDHFAKSQDDVVRAESIGCSPLDIT
jgi:hypothetical protein